MQVPFPLDDLALQAPVPVNLWDPHGVLLLRKGEVLLDEQHRQRLQMHRPMADEAEVKAWSFRYTAAIDRMVRANQSLESIAGVARPMGVAAAPEPEHDAPVEVWPDLHDALATLLYQGAQAQGFLPRLAQIERRMARVLQTRVDDSLFVLVQLLQDRRLGHSATHALLCAVVCRLVGPALDLSPADGDSLQRAALTMNIGMARLHDTLAHQAEPLSVAQREQVQTHPARGAALLQRLGVDDPLWLRCVRDHHAVPEVGGYVDGRTDLDRPVLLLRQADIYVARLAPRADRPSWPAQRAARDAYLGPDGQPTAVGAAFVKTLGAHIPGSYVRLANGECAVVVRRGRRANLPLVMAVINRDGLPLGEPALRDTAEPAHEVKAGVTADTVKLRLPAAKLLARV